MPNLAGSPPADKSPDWTCRIIWIQSAGFCLVILVSWLDELVRLPALCFGSGTGSAWREIALETVVVLLVWWFVVKSTRRILRRLQQLEGMLHMCARCHRIQSDDQWVEPNVFLSRRFDARTSHGMCPVCTEEALKELR